MRWLRSTAPEALNPEFSRLQASRAQAAGALELARRDSSDQPFAALDEAGLAALTALLTRFPGPPRQAWQLPAAEPLLAATLCGAASASTPAA
ncbi:hypothetical protein G3436_13455 [Pseudomonas sp. MAFF212427]|uniref:Uncharacterized protein n=1 Tax=Pseudomonas brassicae TaxID=2708063 RepID=A0A6B3NRF0_9PSED|nr:hypothetical protein [Pseudomonas brassicae]NER64699.1 hypothetical protein [Pseudomonas brassicae]